MKTSAKARRLLKRNWDLWELDEARHFFWIGKYDRCSSLIFPLCKRLIIEPLKDTEEYKDGERKPEEPNDEPPEEESTTFMAPWEEWNVDPEVLAEGQTTNSSNQERDNDGYLIR